MEVAKEWMTRGISMLKKGEEQVPTGTVELLGLLALISITFFVLRILRAFYRYFIRSPKSLKRFGQWAIVTGCTDGIGKAIADEFAKKGLNLLLISRSQDKLAAQAKELESKFKVQTKTVAVDFSSDSPSYLDGVKSAIANLDVGILVNNVGMAYDHAEYFHLLEKEKIKQLVRINVDGTTNMTYLVLPGMVERKRGAIINVSSASSLISEPLYAVYTGTKAYINNFSEALHHEYKSKGIRVQSALPALVTSKLSKVRKSSFFIPSPSTYAKAFVSQLGYEPVSITYWAHALQFALVLSLPRKFICGQLLSRGLDIRSRAYKKKQETKKE